VQHIRRRDKKDLCQIVFNVQVVILKHVVLFRIEYFQQGRARVATKIRSQLVHFVEQQHRVDGAGLFHHLNDLARQRADVGTPMAANFRFIAHATKTEPHKLSSRRAAIDFPRLVLPTPGGPTKQRIDPFGILHQLAHREILENPVLNLLQTKMIFVQNSSALVRSRISFDFCFQGTETSQSMYVRETVPSADIGGMASSRWQFLQRPFLGLFAHAGFFDLLLELVHFRALILAAKFLVDRLICSLR